MEKIYKEENPLGCKPVTQLLRTLAIPAVVANLVNALYNIVDQIFIGQGVGYLGNAATNIAFPIVTICLAIGLMIGIGSASNFNLELGRGNPDKAKYTAGTAAGSLMIIGILFCIFILTFLKPMMISFGATEKILDYAMKYTGITSFGVPFLIFSIGMNPLVRADRSPKYSMIAIIAGAVLNTVLDPIFMFVFNMGIAGAAWATVLSQIVSAILLFLYFPRFKSIKLELKDLIPRFNIIRTIISLGISSFIFQFSTMLVQITTNNLLKIYGSQSIYGSDIPIAVAGIVAKINIIFIAAVIGIVQGAQPIFGYNYGAKNYKRVRETMRTLLTVIVIMSFIIFIIFQSFPVQIISLFGSGSKLYFKFGIKYMRVFLLFIFINGVQISAGTFFPAIGKPAKGVIISFTKQIAILLPLLFLLPRFIGVEGIIYATPITDFISFIIAVFFLINEFKNMPKN
ncbi:MATE family efflux transporter [Leptotrichia sp. OH3620_COT-345]|uniref:MATE family efflux transporter n=1 Tax=Leptotrichia sp. OH3620_COT-345 TaxID=2491048 RepID=UPI000F64CF1A|nr:MATE family efflux transporter [Leptotrichia sp. OH3620_COT-345]RRD39141.1 MATE family efflux transporter [Leptotrichia sp. OH3620_COT-345]